MQGDFIKKQNVINCKRDKETVKYIYTALKALAHAHRPHLISIWMHWKWHSLRKSERARKNLLFISSFHGHFEWMLHDERFFRLALFNVPFFAAHELFLMGFHSPVFCDNFFLRLKKMIHIPECFNHLLFEIFIIFDKKKIDSKLNSIWKTEMFIKWVS